MGVFDPKPSFRGATGMERMASAMDMPYSFGRAFGENVSQGIVDSFGLGTAIRELTTPSGNLGERIDNRTGYKPMFDPLGIMESGQPSLTEDEYKSSPYFRETVPFQPGMTEDRAAALAKFADTRAVRQHFSQKQPVAAFLGQFAGQALDPINYVPVFGQGAQAAAVARFGSIGGRALLSASEAAINTAAFGILTSGVRERLGDDVSFQMIGTEIAMSALIGGAFGGGIGMLVRGRDARERVALAQARNALSTASNRQKAAIALNEQIDALATTGEPAATPNGMAGIEAVTGEVQRRVTAARSLDEQTAGVTGTKAGEVVIAPSGRRVSVRSEVVELDSLIHAEGALQVRNRRTAASDAQIEEIAANLDPARMMPNIDGSQGSPLVGSDNIVDSGNGRVAAVRRAYEAYPERAEAYRASLAAEGYDVSTMQRPVLISRRVTELDEAARAQFNAELNGRTTASLGAVEIAQMDRAAMTDNVLDAHAPAPVTAASNRAFVQRFMAELPANDRQALLTEDGKGLSAEGVRRIENALFASAYGDIDPSAVRRFAEGVDDNTRAIVGAMSDVAGSWTKMRRDAKNGTIPIHLDQTKELTEALRLIGGWREQAAREGRPVGKVIAEGMAQMDLLSGEIAPETKVFIRSFYTPDDFTRAASRQSLTGQFADMIESAYELGRPSLFGDALPDVSGMEVLENAIRRNAEADPRPAGDAISRAEEVGAAQLGDQAGAVGGRDRQGAGGPFNSAAEADAAELLALADAGDIEAIKASPALARVTAEMRSRPETDKVDGYGTQEWMDARAYVAEDGSEITGVEAAQEYLLDNARNLAAKELGIERFETAKERKAVIVIGPPAAGKSTIANQIALRMRAAIPDADEAKKIMPEYAGGIGSNATHEESSFLTRYVMAQLKDDGDNMVIPKVGDKLASIEKLSEEMKAAGYTVDVVLMNVEPKEAFRRMIGRFVKTGRLIPPDYFDSVATAPARVYEELKAKGSTDGYAKIDSPREVQPRVSEGNLRTTDLAAGDEIPIGAGARDGGTNGSSGGSSEAGQVLAEADIFSHGADLGTRPTTPADIADAMRERFELAGRPPEEAEAASAIVSNFYATMAARLGRSINDLLKIAPLPEVRRGDQPDMSAQALAQAARTATDTPEFREWFGDSKVVDAEGKPLVVYHATAADFDAFKPSRGVTFLSLTPDGAMKGAGGGSHDFQQAGAADRIMPLYVRAEAIEHTQPPKQVVAEIEALPDEISVARYDQLREGREFYFTRALSYAYNDGFERGGEWFVRKDMSPLFKSLEEVARTGRDWMGQILPGYNTGLDADAKMGAQLAERGYDATLVSDESGVALVIADPTQIKSVNNRGTFDPNDPRILYQGPGAPVPPDLYVVHNIKPGGVLNAQKIGGLAMPSLAVTRLGSGDFSSYGSISLIGSPDLIDPKAAKEAKTFNADAYSPRYPSVQYDVDTKAFSDLNKRVVEKAREIGGDEHRGALDPNHIEDRGIESEIDSPGLMRLYLAEKGEVPDVVMREDGKGPDFYGNDDAMKKAIQPQRAEYEEWARAQLAPLVKRERIFKGFDNNGNRRYREHNMENVLADMRSRLREGEGFNYGIGTIRSKHAKQFKSIEAMQKARDKIVPHKGDDIEGTKDEFGDRFFALADEMRPYYKFEANSFQYPDDTAMMFGEVGQKGMRALDEGFKDLPPDLRQKVQEFLADLADAPTEYFETKMQRAVGLGEFQAALVPSDTTPNVRKALEKAGLQVIEYDPEVEGSRVEAVKALNAGRREADPRILFQGARGSIEFGSDGRSVMSMFDAADASTALHESAHWFLQMFRNFADTQGAPPEIKADWERIRAWWTENADAVAADSPTPATGDDVRMLMEHGTTGDRIKDLGIEVGMQEQWARGFEAYLREGVAPSEGLRAVFEQFKKWLTGIYRQALDLNVNINDDIRGVFDRLLTQERESLIPAPVKAQPDPPPTGLDVAAIETRKPADPMNLGAQYGLESNGGFAEEADIAALKANDLIDDEGVREMAAADQLVADADAYGKTLETAAWCMMH